MRSVLEQILDSYLGTVDLNDVSDARFRALVDLYKDLVKLEKQPIQEEGQADDAELAAFIKALQDNEI